MALAESVFAVAARTMEQHGLQTPQLADACERLGIGVRCGPPTIRPLAQSMFCAGRARPVKLNGNFEALLEILENSDPGNVLVIDGAGEPARCCMGDLMAAEIKNAGLSGIMIWGAHRDTLDLVALGLPIFSIGAFPFARSTPPSSPGDGPARVGEAIVTSDDFVACDCDGSVFVRGEHVGAAIEAALQIQEGELARARHMRDGHGLREQLAYADYRARRKVDPSYTFKVHTKSLADRRK